MNVKNMSAQGGSASGRKKILYFITQAEFGGAQRYVFDLANNLKGEYEVAVALGEQGNNGKLAKILAENNIKYFIIPHLKRNLSPLNDLLALFKIVRLIKNYRPDIIHLNSSKISILGSLASLGIMFHAPRVIYTVHGWVFNEPLPRGQKWFYLWAEKFTARFKNKIICVSEYDRRLALEYKIAPENKLVAIHNGLTPINFYTKAQAKEILHLPTANLLIGSIGNLYKTKGYEFLIQAADRLINQHHLAATFLIIGEGEERKNLENLIKEYNLENNFILAGKIDGAAELLTAFDLYVCSSVKEGFPYSVLEAMSAGLPIISTKVGGIPEIITDKKTGRLIKPAEPNDLTEKIRELISNKALAAELGRQAKEKVIAEFGLEKMLEATKKIYQ